MWAGGARVQTGAAAAAAGALHPKSKLPTSTQEETNQVSDQSPMKGRSLGNGVHQRNNDKTFTKGSSLTLAMLIHCGCLR